MAKIYLISLGCSKNLVDSEHILGLLAKDKHIFVKTPKEADVLIINTCSFIAQARKEAKFYINKFIKLKQKYNYKLFVVGCLPQLEKENLIKQYPQIDAVIGISDYYKIPKILKNFKQNTIEVSSEKNFILNCAFPRVVSTPKSYAYLKIADGCDNRCAYCLIPTIRGPYRERPIEDIVEEAKKIVDCGVKELIIISHDTTFYGKKIYKKQMLHKLLKELSKIKDLFWIRILYTHPGHYYEELIKEIKDNEKVCKYLDIPIQHTSDKVLSLMKRNITRRQIFELIERLKKEIKDITIRTTVMVGFPGETEKEFKFLLDDIKNLEFDWLGAFKFSKEKNTLAFSYELEKVPKEIVNERFKDLMLLQQKITFKKNKDRLGKIYNVLCDNSNFGHTEFQTPEEDGRTIFSNPAKDIVGKIKITDVDIYDISGEII